MTLRLTQGLFFVFEGIDGSGKTSQINRLAGHLRSLGLDVLQTLEPTAGPWGKKALDLIVHGRGDVTPEEELSYFIKDREENVRDVIAPNLRANKVIIQDRYYYSTAAYQGALGLNVDDILARNRAFAPEPHAVFCLDIDVDTALDRIRNSRGDTPNHFENRAYLAKVLAVYESFASDTFHRLNGTQSPDALFQQILAIVQPLLDAHAAH